jgi:hypothetical protein
VTKKVQPAKAKAKAKSKGALAAKAAAPELVTQSYPGTAPRVFIYNLIFEWGKRNGNFRTPGMSVLEQSKTWLEAHVATPAVPPAHSESEMNSCLLFTEVGVAGSCLFLSNSQDAGSEIWVRVAEHSSDPAPGGTKVKLAACFGRPVSAAQTESSPFVDGQQIITTFLSGAVSGWTRTLDTANRRKTTEWWFRLGPITPTPAPTQPNVNFRYEFAIGIVATSGNSMRHYGEDPEMDIGM